MRTRWCASVLLAGALAGCVSLPTNSKESDVSAAAKVSSKSRPPVRPVTADQITEANASQKAEELRQELNREAELLAEPPQGK